MVCKRTTWATLIACCFGLSSVTGYAAPPQPKVLNNFVSELLNVKIAASPEQTYEFTNPRDGWIFFSTTLNEIRPAQIQVSFETAPQNEVVIVHKQGETAEAMRWLAAGQHKVDVRTEGNPSARLIVRAIPEILYSGFWGDRSSPDGAPYTPRNDRLYLHHWDFLLENVLGNVNVLLGAGESHAPAPYMQEWLAAVNATALPAASCGMPCEFSRRMYRAVPSDWAGQASTRPKDTSTPSGSSKSPEMSCPFRSVSFFITMIIGPSCQMSMTRAWARNMIAMNRQIRSRRMSSINGGMSSRLIGDSARWDCTQF